METEIIKTDDENIVIEKITTQTEINLTLIREERDGCLLLLEEQEEIGKRLQDKLDLMEDDEIKEIIQKKIDEVNENKRWNLIRIADLSRNLE